MRRQLAEIEREQRALADSPWAPPPAPRARHLRVEDFDTPAERVMRVARRLLLTACIVLALAVAIALVETALRP